MDWNLVMGDWRQGQKHSYHHTGFVNSLCGLRKALLILAVEGLEFSGQRHMKNHLALQTSLDVIGLIFVVPEAEGLPKLNIVSIPDGVDEARVRTSCYGNITSRLVPAWVRGLARSGALP
jgi:alanine-glyoxylate transaminase/serine-glyoxylate transaminase/serine-pyruvate transaminase